MLCISPWNGDMEPPFREVYKCSWLKLSQGDKKNSFTKQWVIFCVHNDTSPFLEIYSDEKAALTHKPNFSFQLNNILHITPTICPHDDDEYEFVITFPTEMIRLSASSQHQMMSWVTRLNTKLREMKVLAPGENLYTSHLPENRSHLLPTRDPNSPLPLPPAMPYIPPGVEPVSATSNDLPEAVNREPEISALRNVSESNIENHPEIITESVQINVEDSNVLISPEEPAHTPVNKTSSERWHTDENVSDATNVTVIEVSTSRNVFDFSTLAGELLSSTVSVVPVNGNGTPDDERVSRNHWSDADSEISPISATLENGVLSNNHYEHVFLPTVSQSARSVPTPTNASTPSSEHPTSPEALNSTPACASNIMVSVSNPVPSTSGSAPVPSSPGAQPTTAIVTNAPITSINMQRSSAPSQLPKMGRGREFVRGRRRSNSTSDNSSSHQPVAADRIRNAGPVMGPNQRLQPAPHPFVRQVNSEDYTSLRLTLREQQVLQLRREMSHPGGVRLQLRRKDCLNSIALVDAFQAVWIAGWKQKEHPMLYTALHIGDQLISLGGKLVHSSTDAQKLIRAWPSLYIEFVVRRLPCGRVYALRREHDGQCVGITRDGNTAEIKEVSGVAAAQGLTSKVRTMNGLAWTTWYITEINGRPLNLFFKENQVKDRLNAVGLDMSLLVQPTDLVKQLRKQLKLLRNYKEYIVQ